jgi:methylenetetrahydrofolate reductase (NADPH)
VQESLAIRKNFPWRGSRTNLKGDNEEVRPINWANRPKSYIKRTVHWDEFPNGRWGDNRSPAYGELSDSHFFRPVEGKPEDLIAMWGEAPMTPEDVYDVFAKYIEGKIPITPWCESALQAETIPLTPRIAAINRAGFLTINSQPAVNGERSDHQIYGWGGTGGRVYQKAYVEFFASPAHLKALMQCIQHHPMLNYYAIDSSGTEYNAGHKSVIALTWGCFPNKEILQPTVFDHDSFVVWSREVFQLWTKCWASLYEDDSESADLLYNVSAAYMC